MLLLTFWDLPSRTGSRVTIKQPQLRYVAQKTTMNECIKSHWEIPKDPDFLLIWLRQFQYQSLLDWNLLPNSWIPSCGKHNSASVPRNGLNDPIHLVQKYSSISHQQGRIFGSKPSWSWESLRDAAGICLLRVDIWDSPQPSTADLFIVEH